MINRNAYFIGGVSGVGKSTFLKKLKEINNDFEIIKLSLSNWCILRIGAILPTRLLVSKDIFSIPSGVYFRFICIEDAVTALTNAIESNESKGKTFLIGGGK